MLEIPFNPFPTHVLCARVNLEPLTDAELPQRSQWTADDELARLMGVDVDAEPVESLEVELENNRQWLLHRLDQGARVYALKVNNRYIGDADLFLMPMERLAQITLFIGDRESWSQGYGTETVEGRDAYHLVAENLDRKRSFNEDQEFVLQTINAWIDIDDYVPLKLVMDGTMDTDGTPRPVTIETIERDYRTVPGSNMYEPYQQVMRLTGEMADETKRQMEQARTHLAELDKQLAEMPESQRQMMMGMMGEEIEMMRKMAAGDGIEIITTVRSITVE